MRILRAIKLRRGELTGVEETEVQSDDISNEERLDGLTVFSQVRDEYLQRTFQERRQESVQQPDHLRETAEIIFQVMNNGRGDDVTVYRYSDSYMYVSPRFLEVLGVSQRLGSLERYREAMTDKKALFHFGLVLAIMSATWTTILHIGYAWPLFKWVLAFMAFGVLSCIVSFGIGWLMSWMCFSEGIGTNDF